MKLTGFAFLGVMLPSTVSSARSTFIASRAADRSLLSLRPKQVSSYRQTRFLRCDLAPEQSDYIVEEAGSEFDMDDVDLNFDDIEFPVGIPMLNSVQLTGRLGADPELKIIRDDLEVCKFSLAVQHEYDPSADPDDNTSWFNVEVWGNFGRSVASRVRKGLRVGVIGSMDINAWTNSDGELVENPIVTANSVEVLQSRSETMSPMDKRMQSPRSEEDNSSDFGANSKYSGIQIDGDLKDLPF